MVEKGDFETWVKIDNPKINKMVDVALNNNMSNIRLGEIHEIFNDEEDARVNGLKVRPETYVLTLYGGNNMRGSTEIYLTDITNAINVLKANGATHVVLLNWETDVADDVFTVKLICDIPNVINDTVNIAA